MSATARFGAEEMRLATGGRWEGAPPAAPCPISTDSRAVAPGDAFLALRGERFDAHAFVAAAARAGAACAVVSSAWLDGARAAGAAPPLPVLAVPDTLEALGNLARFHRARFDVPVVGVTGSNGKTTTREMVACILATRGPVLRTEGNLNNEVGVPLTLFRLGAEHRAAVIEMGMSHPGEIARLAAIAAPRVGVVTNASAAHLEGLGTVDAVARAKGELYQGLPFDGVAVANADDPRMLARARKCGRRVLTFSAGADREADVVVLDVLSETEAGLDFLLGVGTKELRVRLPLVGRHNAANAAAAAAAAVALGCSDGRSSAASPTSARWGAGCAWSGCRRARCSWTTATTPTRRRWRRRSAPSPGSPGAAGRSRRSGTCSSSGRRRRRPTGSWGGSRRPRGWRRSRPSAPGPGSPGRRRWPPASPRPTPSTPRTRRRSPPGCGSGCARGTCSS